MIIERITQKIEEIENIKMDSEDKENKLHILKLYKNYQDLNSNKNLNLKIENFKSIKRYDDEEYNNLKKEKNNFVYVIDLNSIKNVRSFYEVTNYRYEKILSDFELSNISKVFKKYRYPIIKCDLEKNIRKLEKAYYLNKKQNKDNKNIILLYKNYNGSNKQKDILKILSKAVILIQIEDKKERISKVYDFLCEYLENDIKLLKYCDFRNSACVAQRDKINDKRTFPKYEKDGCCHSYLSPNKCEYLNKDNSCDITCISCRAFVCKYLQERGQGYNFFNSVIFRCFCSPLNNKDFVWNFFQPKGFILKK